MKKKSFKKKKGISSLISTVLIIGFTIALAAIILTFGSSFMKKTTKETKEASEKQMACGRDLVFEIEEVCYREPTIRYKYQIDLILANNGAVDIADGKGKVIFEDGTEEHFEFNELNALKNGIPPYAVIKAMNIGSYAQQPKKVAIVPIIETEKGEKVTCIDARLNKDIKIKCS